MNRLAGPDIFSMLQMKGHVLHRARAHLKVFGLTVTRLTCTSRLTKKLPMIFCPVRMKVMEAAKRFYQYWGHFKVI